MVVVQKKQAQAGGLPPTRAALVPSLLRVHYQNMVWHNDIVARPELPDPEQYGRDRIDGCFQPVTTSLPPCS